MPIPDDEAKKEAQKAAAESLKRQIEDLRAGRAPRKKPTSLREIFKQKMAEDDAKKRRKDPGGLS